MHRPLEKSRDPLSASFRCRACGGDAEVATYEVPDREYGVPFVATYVACGSCGSLTQHPMPTLEQLTSFYPEEYHSFHNRNFIVRLRYQLRINRLKRLAGDGGGAILDYGCGDASFLLEAARQWQQPQFYGFEIAGKKHIEVLAKGRVVRIEGSPRDLFNELPACRLITMNHVIEHLPDPLDVVGRCLEKLLPGCFFEGQTPAADSLERTVFGTKWSGFHAPRHTVVFSRLGLQRLLERAGYEHVRVQGAFNPAAIAVSLLSLRSACSEGGRIHRQGWRWLGSLAAATLLHSLEVVLRMPGVVNFSATRMS